MADRVAASRSPEVDHPDNETKTPAEDKIRHCWVTDHHGRLPGLLLQWRRRPDGWHGRVVRPVLESDGWVVVQEWLPAGLLDPA